MGAPEFQFGRETEMVRVSKDPGLAGSWRYRGASIWVSGPVGSGRGAWSATAKFRGKEQDFSGRSLAEVLGQAADWVDEPGRQGFRANTMRVEKRFRLGDAGAVYEFKVKLSMRVRGVKISDAELEQETRFAVDVFADTLREKYPWVGDVGLTGRSGGWLAIEDKGAESDEERELREYDLREIDELVRAAKRDFETAIIESFGYEENGAGRREMTPNPVWPTTAEERVDLMNAIAEAGYSGQKAAHVIRELNWWRKRNRGEESE